MERGSLRFFLFLRSAGPSSKNSLISRQGFAEMAFHVLSWLLFASEGPIYEESERGGQLRAKQAEQKERGEETA
jgi:hypothetical protein